MAKTTGKKYGGRKKGTPNKDTKQLREKIENLLSEQWEQILQDLRELTPKERIDTFTKLLEYSLPKLNRTELKATNKLEDILNMTPQERHERIKELSKKIQENGN